MKDPLQKTEVDPAGPASERLEGQIERITYMNEETGFTVARAHVSGFPAPVTLVGNLLALRAGEVLEMEGVWESHKKFGRQFRVLDHRTKLPATVKGIRKYLGSGLIKGVGKVMASRIVDAFGEKTLEVIDERIEDLARVEGIGLKRMEMIRAAWAEQKDVRSIMIFLHEHGVGPSHAAKIYRQYGQRAVAVVSQNPYRLASDIPGIGFPSADRIARNLGFEKNAPVRAESGILYVLNRLAEEGHVFYPYDPLIEKCREILELDRDTVIRAFGTIALEGRIVIEDLNQGLDDFEPNLKAVYLSRFHHCESEGARHLARLGAARKSLRSMDTAKALEWVEKRIRMRLAPMQREAVKKAVSEKVMVITGGPGTGKTTIIHAVMEIYRAVGARLLLAAPTGRAAKRMSDATGHTARTIHRLLEFSWQKGGFQRHEGRPLEADVVILDEVSMVDTLLIHHLLKAVPSEATLILVGDINQLPSVGPGNVLRDIIHSERFPVIRLTEIFRQARESLIVVNAHRINRGRIPETRDFGLDVGDFYFIEQDDPEQTLALVLSLVCTRIPKRFRLDPMSQIQVLAPMHKGILGTENLNRRLQNVLNPSGAELTRGDRQFRVRDRVMQIRNNYEKEVFNGDIGQISAIRPEVQEVQVTFEGRPVTYGYADLDEIVPAYAISVHKSQGSEYPAVVIPIVPQHYLLLQRNLIYTAVTRGERLVVMVGTKQALAMGVRNDRIARRYTNLADRLRSR
jgi:exodeoxyribonuclease V alpha subunit